MGKQAKQHLLLILTIEVEAEQIQIIRLIANPEKLARI
jgi:hypothetical protein